MPVLADSPRVRPAVEPRVRSATPVPLTRESRIALVGTVVIAGVAAAIAYHYYLGVCHGRPYPANTYLFRPHAQFRDFLDVYGLTATPEKFHGRLDLWCYFPFGHLLPDALIWLEPNAALLAYLTLLWVGIFWICRSETRAAGRWQTLRNALILACLPYPVQFVLDRANLEGVVFLLLSLFVGLVCRGRYGWSTLPLAMALAIKPFPAVFLVLLIVRRRFKEAVMACAAASGLTAVAAGILAWQTGYRISYLAPAADFYSEFMVVRGRGIPFGHSLWGLVWTSVHWYTADFFPGANPEDILTAARQPYFLTVIGLFGGICWYLVYERTFWKQVALLTFSMNLFPFISADYKLLHTLIPLFCFINARERERLDWGYAVLFGLLLIPKNYLTLDLPRLFDANLGVLVNPLLMVVFVIAIIGSGLRQRAPEGAIQPP
jgi:hypothetical protein